MTDLDCLSVTIAATRAQSSSGKGFSVHSSCLSSFPLGWPCSSAGWPLLPMDGSATLWMYHSHVDEVRDTNTGLIGPLIVTKRGMARADGGPKDVDRELVTLFSIMNENESWLLPRNVHDFTQLRGPRASPEALEHDDEFGESNLMHSINGYVYGTLPRPR